MASGSMENMKEIQDLLQALYEARYQGARYHQFLCIIQAEFVRENYTVPYKDFNTGRVYDLLSVEDNTYKYYLTKKLEEALANK